ncbi:chemotaxis regulatin CheY-phosphate phosphatase CheZ [Nitrospirillum amazonense]|uniref:Chemotaxis regulatin CheY-phosphate phosphatase CheZ n=2 Tax=Nitrospirillum amazonense TaxID=28077 RepID=A0A560G1E9_9PROT|nr:chemotaxis regulatin CheY-phosphate phosphatase CheZ [Nitrospirillum amazonense]TWB82579.1 chemotaxis regulatin CheY-phosphate phosphatase CheZ [Nitrospirillum amazonense]
MGMQTTRSSGLTLDEYRQMEESLLATAKGRDFFYEVQRRARSVETDELRRTIASIQRLIAASRNDPAPAPAGGQLGNPEIAFLKAEVEAMANTIRLVKREIAAIKPSDPKADRISAATSELDAIVTATEEATNRILTTVERMTGALRRLRPGRMVDGQLLTALENACMDVMMACSFQDICGQRTAKVVNTLSYIEERVGVITGLWRTLPQASTAPAMPPADAPREVLLPYKHDDARPDAHLLHGPALQAPSQTTIDALFSAVSPAQPVAAKPAAPVKDMVIPSTTGLSADALRTQQEIDALFEAAH